MPYQHGAVEPRHLLVRAGRDRVVVLVPRVVAEAVGVRQPLVVVGESRRQRIHELERDAELGRADVVDAGGGELFLDTADVELPGGLVPAFRASDLRPVDRNEVTGERDATGVVARDAAADAAFAVAAAATADAAAIRLELLGVAVGRGAAAAAAPGLDPTCHFKHRFSLRTPQSEAPASDFTV